MANDNSITASLSADWLVGLQTGDPQAWQRFVRVFGPLVYQWSRASHLNPADAADVVQDVFQKVYVGLPSFQHDRPQDSFRGWIAVITRNRIRDHYRAKARQTVGQGGTDFQQLVAQQPNLDTHLTEELSSAELSPEFSSRERAMTVRRAAQLLEHEFEPKTWAMFWRTTVEEESPSAVAQSLGVMVTAVYKAKSRVLKRLRENLGPLWTNRP